MRAIVIVLGATLATAASAQQPPPVSYPCKTTPEFRQLDFWVGEWDVTDPSGHLVGHSSIQRIIGDCVIYENWQGARGHTGKSFNFWDKENRRWQQTWVDDGGGVQQYWGTLDGGAMRYATPAGTMRLTFSPLPGGKVRQLSESTKDGGKSWTVNYDFTYARAK